MHTVQTVYGFYASPILLTHSSDTLKGCSSGPTLSVEQMMHKKFFTFSLQACCLLPTVSLDIRFAE